MITWISNLDYFLNIETPMVTENGLFIQYYNKLHLYHDVYKYQINVTGSKPEAIKAFEGEISNSFHILKYSTRNVKLNELICIKRIIAIILYNLNYDIDVINHHIDDDRITFIPTVKIKPYNKLQTVEYIYIVDDINIDIDEIIGYKPLIDLQMNEVSLELAASDLIWTCDLDKYAKYEVIYSIPVIKLDSIENLELKSKEIEFLTNVLPPLSSYVYDLKKNTFSITPDDSVKKIIENYKFKIIPSVKNYYLQHEYLDYDWIQQSVERIKNDKTPMITLSGEWVFLYQATLKSISLLRYAAIRSYHDIYHDISKMLNQINDITVGFDLLIRIPINHIDDVNVFKSKIDEYMNQNLLIYIDDKADVINQFIALSKHHYLTFPIYDQWALIGDKQELKNVVNQNVDVKDEIIGLYDVKINHKKIKGLTHQN